MRCAGGVVFYCLDHGMTGARLASEMARAGLTVAELAALLRLSEDTVASWRQSRRHPCCRHMRIELARVLRAEKGKR